MDRCVSLDTGKIVTSMFRLHWAYLYPASHGTAGLVLSPLKAVGILCQSQREHPSSEGPGVPGVFPGTAICFSWSRAHRLLRSLKGTFANISQAPGSGLRLFYVLLLL